MAAIVTLTVDLPQDDDLKTTLEAGLQALKIWLRSHSAI